MAASREASDAQSRQVRFVFLDYLRALAAGGVIWDHVVASWGGANGFQPWLLSGVRDDVARPLGIIQDFGWLAVALFFLISGFIISHVAQHEQVGEFLVKRFFRIFPMLALFTGLAYLLLPWIRLQAGLGDIVKSMLLLNYFTNGVGVVGVAWTLAIEVLFYLLTAATMRLRRPALILAANLAIVAGVLAESGRHGDAFFLFAANTAYLPYLIAGQVLYFGVHLRAFGAWATAAGLAACYALALMGLRTIHTSFLPLDNSYLINAFYAAGVFAVFLSLDGRLRPSRTVRLLADVSFASYMVHGVVGWVVFNAVLPRLGVTAAVAAALGVTLAASVFVHYALERPVLALGRRLGHRVRFNRPVRVQANASA